MNYKIVLKLNNDPNLSTKENFKNHANDFKLIGRRCYWDTVNSFNIRVINIIMAIVKMIINESTEFIFITVKVNLPKVDGVSACHQVRR